MAKAKKNSKQGLAFGVRKALVVDAHTWQGLTPEQREKAVKAGALVALNPVYYVAGCEKMDRSEDQIRKVEHVLMEEQARGKALENRLRDREVEHNLAVNGLRSDLETSRGEARRLNKAVKALTDLLGGKGESPFEGLLKQFVPKLAFDMEADKRRFR